MPFSIWYRLFGSINTADDFVDASRRRTGRANIVLDIRDVGDNYEPPVYVHFVVAESGDAGYTIGSVTTARSFEDIALPAARYFENQCLVTTIEGKPVSDFEAELKSKEPAKG